jgi:hypothetical protein
MAKTTAKQIAKTRTKGKGKGKGKDRLVKEYKTS